jgi:hypothetical protein
MTTMNQAFFFSKGFPAKVIRVFMELRPHVFETDQIMITNATVVSWT